MMKTNFASRNLSWAAIRHGDKLSVFRGQLRQSHNYMLKHRESIILRI
jgi:hypothetical protein